MTGTVIAAWLHYMSIMVMFAAVLAEHLLLKPRLTLEQARRLQRLDLVYGVAAGAVLATGVVRIFTEKGLDYYLHAPGFHGTVGLFVVVGLLSIYPTVAFMRWRSSLVAGHAPELGVAHFRRLQGVIRVELTLLLLVPLFAAWMARG